jgi:hypothetical protein
MTIGKWVIWEWINPWIESATSKWAHEPLINGITYGMGNQCYLLWIRIIPWLNNGHRFDSFRSLLDVGWHHITGMVWSHDCILQGAVASWFILRHLQLDHGAEIFEKNWRGDAAVVRRFCLALWGHGVSNVFRTCLASSRACPWQSLQVKQFTSNFAEACLETKFVGRDANHRPCVAESEVLAAFETASSREKGRSSLCEQRCELYDPTMDMVSKCLLTLLTQRDDTLDWSVMVTMSHGRLCAVDLVRKSLNSFNSLIYVWVLFTVLVLVLLNVFLGVDFSSTNKIPSRPSYHQSA